MDGTHTHTLVFASATVTKLYSSWDRGEPRREWEALNHIHRHAPDVVPQPIAADLDAVPPTVTMTIVPGRPMTGGVTRAQVLALARALRTLWVIPADELVRSDSWADDLGFARRLIDAPRPTAGPTAMAFDAAIAWSRGPDPVLLRTPPPVLILGHRDPNLRNYLWDGHRVRIVDFEDAAISDPATELAILVEHLSARHLDLRLLCAQVDVDERRLQAARRLWAMFWLSRLLPGGLSAHRNPPGTVEAQALRLLDLLETD